MAPAPPTLWRHRVNFYILHCVCDMRPTLYFLFSGGYLWLFLAAIWRLHLGSSVNNNDINYPVKTPEL